MVKRFVSPLWIRKRRGFSLVELAIALLIIGILAIIAVAAFKRITHRSQNTRFVHDLRVFTQAFENYSMSNGEWPADTAPSVIPPGMLATDLMTHPWTRATSIGGQWKWDSGVGDVSAGIAVVIPTVSSAQIAEIDRIVDDGNATTGIFRTRADGGYVYVLQQ